MFNTLVNPKISHPTLDKIQFEPNRFQRLLLSYLQELTDKNVIFLTERQRGVTTAIALWLSHLTITNPDTEYAVVNSRLETLKKINNIFCNLAGEHLFSVEQKILTFKNGSKIHLLNSFQADLQMRGHFFEKIVFDNSVPVLGYMPTKQKIYFVTTDHDSDYCWFNFTKLPNDDYKLIKV